MPTTLPSSLVLFSISVVLLQGCTALTTPFTTKNQSSTAAVSTDYDAYYGQPVHTTYQAGNRVRSVKNVRGLGPGSGSVSPLKENAPVRYVVKKGDTLWGVSNRFLKDPSYWPEIWNNNQKVRNPHQLVPGDVLSIHYISNSPTQQQGNAEKLIPTIRITRKGTGEPISTLMPLLSWPRVVSKDDLLGAPYIVAGRDASLLLDGGKKIYVKGLAHSQRGDTYGIYQAGKELIDPESKRLIGTEISYHGQASIVRPDAITTATIEKNTREIRKGDHLIKVDPGSKPLDMPITIPTIKVRGAILSLYDAELISGQYMIATINRGHKAGIRPGYILGVYSPPKLAVDPYQSRLDNYHSKQPVGVRLPPEKVGSMIVYSVSEKFSYALISQSDHEIKNGYKIGNP